MPFLSVPSLPRSGQLKSQGSAVSSPSAGPGGVAVKRFLLCYACLKRKQFFVDLIYLIYLDPTLKR